MNKLKTSLDSPEDSSPTTKLSQCYKIRVEKTVKMVPPDGGWGWMIVLGSFIGMVLGTFPVFSFSILFSPILMSHAVSSTKTAWIYNVHSLVWSLTTLFIGPLCDEFGWRKIALFGGITNSISVLLSAFAPSPEYLFFSFSLLGGVGGASALSLSFFVVSRYFEKHRGFALGITTIGGCTSSFLAPIVANYLLEHYGYMGASLIFGGIVLNQCVGGSLYQPVEWHMKPEVEKILYDEDVNEELLKNGTTDEKEIQKKSLKEAREITAISVHSTDSVCHSLINISTLPTVLEEEEEKNVDEDTPKNTPKNTKSENKFCSVLKSTFINLKSLKYMRVNLIAFGYCGLVLGYINFQMWIPFVITNAGYSLEMAAWCSSFAAVGNVIGRIVMSLLSDRKFFNVIYGYMFGLLLIGSSIIAFSLVNDIKLYLISTCGWGLGIGSALALNVTVMIDVMGVEMLPAVLGVASLFKGFGGISLGTLTGVIRDATSSYTYALWMLGGCEFMAFCMWFLMPCGQRFDEKKYPKDMKKQEEQNS